MLPLFFFLRRRMLACKTLDNNVESKTHLICLLNIIFINIYLPITKIIFYIKPLNESDCPALNLTLHVRVSTGRLYHWGVRFLPLKQS